MVGHALAEEGLEFFSTSWAIESMTLILRGVETLEPGLDRLSLSLGVRTLGLATLLP